MNAIHAINSAHPTPEQWREIDALTATLAPDQAVWLSGYFAGLGQSLRADNAGQPDDLVPVIPSVATSSRSAARKLSVLFGSETGNGADLAHQIGERAKILGMEVRVGDMNAYKPRNLKDEEDLIIVTSTHGEGDPPEPAVDFFEFVLGRRAPKLQGVRYVVIGLGDSTYEFFCGAAKALDERLEVLGARRLKPRLDCDVDYEDRALTGIDDVLDSRTGEGEGAAISAAPVGDTAGAGAGAVTYGKRNPFAAPILENIVLTGRDSTKETRHVELSLEGSNLAFEPGDALGVFPRNDPHLVEMLLREVGLNADDTIVANRVEKPLAEALERDVEISLLTPRFIEHWAMLADASDLKALSAPESRSELAAFMRTNHVLDLVRDYPVKGLTGPDFFGELRSLQPRLYSIASSHGAMPDEVHLTISTVRYQLRDEMRVGVTSSLLAERLGEDDSLSVYVQANPHFRLPLDANAPIIMIGAGTGIAPYRAFLQDREIRGSGSRSWLVFGERNFRNDFLYQTEWQAFLKSGILTHMDVAFSRDQAEKVYVHHRLREQGRRLYGWLEDGAHLYVCGDAATMAPDVHEAMLDVVAEQARFDRGKAEEYLRNLQRSGRYQKDVY